MTHTLQINFADMFSKTTSDRDVLLMAMSNGSEFSVEDCLHEIRNVSNIPDLCEI